MFWFDEIMRYKQFGLFLSLQMEFEDILPYQDFAFRFPQHAIYRLPVVLNEILALPGRVRSFLTGQQTNGSSAMACKMNYDELEASKSTRMVCYLVNKCTHEFFKTAGV